ncbi:unnamed protein product [Pedinophyceae sp. YPF-701]|nr:unnamed protein product [Pedinophyceae sp. YPF-701]
MAIKQIDRAATTAFCPNAPYIATGSMSGAIDMSFSTNSTLEIFNLDLDQATGECSLAGGAVPAPERFHRLAWGGCSSPSSRGLLAGGLADGVVCVWDPSKIIGTQSPSKASCQVATLQKHKGAVRGLEFCPSSTSPWLLASGGDDGELCIWDLNNPASPSLLPALGTDGQSPKGDIAHLSWHRKVQHILASTSNTGTTVVWDLRRQKPVISFRDPASARRCSALQWHPEVGTQLIVASVEDACPTLQLWDLRNSQSPVREIAGHHKGVLAASWSPHDPSLLLTCAKDNRTVCWDVPTGSTVCEVAGRPGSGSNYNFCVAWCPTEPGVFATSSFDGRVTLSSLLACTAPEMREEVREDFSTVLVPSGPSRPLAKPPNWMQRPAAASFAFGTRLVSVANSRAPGPDPAQPARTSGRVTVSQVQTETDLVSLCEAFGQAVGARDPSALLQLCQRRQGEADAQGSPEGAVWRLLAGQFDADARGRLLDFLGFERPPERRQEVADLGQAEQSLAAAQASANGDAHAPPPADGADPSSFFDDLAAMSLQPPAGGAAPEAAVKEEASADAAWESTDETDKAVQGALLTGDFEGAVGAAISAGRMADALLLASLGGPALLAAAQQVFTARAAASRPYVATAAAIASGDLTGLVKTRPVALWRETLALLCTYAPTDAWRDLCALLGHRLSKAARVHEATLVFVCGGNVDQAVSAWCRGLGGSPSPTDLHAALEKGLVLAAASGGAEAPERLGKLVSDYAGILVSQGRMDLALQFLDMVPGEEAGPTAVLRDRIARSWWDNAAAVPQPPFPFVGEEVYPVVQEEPAAPSPTAHGGQGAGYDGWGAQSTHSQQQAAQGWGQQAAPQTSYQQPQASYQQPQASYQQPQAQQQTAYRPAQPAPQQQPVWKQTSVSQPQQPQTQPQQQQQQQPAAYNAPRQQPAAYNPPPQQEPGYSAQTPAAYGASAAPAAYAKPAGSPYAGTSTPAGAAATQYMPAPRAPQAPASSGYSGHAAQPQPGMMVPQPAAHAASGGAYGGDPRTSGGYGQQQQAPQAQQPGMFVPQPAPAPNTPASGPTPPKSQGPYGGGMPGYNAPAPKPAPPAQPPADISIATFDASSLDAQGRAIVASFGRVWKHCSGMQLSPQHRKAVDDAGKKFGVLAWQLSQGGVKERVLQKLVGLSQALDRQDAAAVGQAVTTIVKEEFDSCSQWATALKRLLRLMGVLH